MKLQYLIPRDVEITPTFISKAIQDFSTRRLPELNKCWNYYNGKQKIIRKKASDVGKPNNIVIANYCNSIVKNYLGYLTGKPITYDNEGFQEVLDILSYNDVVTEDSELLRQALIFGRTYEVSYIDEEGKKRFRLFDSRECLPIYDNSLNNELLYVIRFYKEDLLDESNPNYIVECYGPNSIRTYRATPGFFSVTLIDEVPHHYGQCPVTVFSLNEDEESVFNQIITLQDAYNELLSGGVDDFDAFADAYLVLKGVIANEEELEDMKRNRVLMIDTDAEANYLTKDINNTQLEYLLSIIDEQIHTISNSPNFNDEKFMAQSGEAIKYKLVGFENQASSIENNMRKALQRRIELLCAILAITNIDGNEQTWRDVRITFTRNLPSSLMPNTVSDLNGYRNLVSNETLLSLVPFINDVGEEVNKVNNEKDEEIKRNDLYEGSFK